MTPEEKQDHLFMTRALTLAARGKGLVSPNPLVGCVIVAENGQIIGEGWHQRYGEAHAEVNAIRSVEQPARLSKATAYVTLEPCAHFGKTPPCADLLIKHQIPRVVVGMEDPFAAVNGVGIARIRTSGARVTVGVLEKECRRLNKRFLTFHEKKRPYVILKWAQTADGFIARSDYSSKWISDGYSRTLTHKWRSEEAAILVGTNTLRYDNPSLDVRLWSGKPPLRIILDRNLSTVPDRKVFQDGLPTLCYHKSSATSEQTQAKNTTFIRLNNFSDPFPEILADLYARNITSLFVEGGAKVHESFLKAELWDEIRFFVSPARQFGSGIAAPQPQGHLMLEKNLRNDRLYVYSKNNA